MTAQRLTLFLQSSESQLLPSTKGLEQCSCPRKHPMKIPASTLVAMMATSNTDKSVVFVRHGCTYMNEYLGRVRSFGAPHFADVFESSELDKYQDSKLSPLGVQQAKKLSYSCSFATDVDLVVVSPLTRALQTFEIGMKAHIGSQVPVIALPEAAERLYLISDVGRSVDELQAEYEYVDFSNCKRDGWWYQCEESYEEWRPTGQGQRYACKGEPALDFQRRMSRLYEWLEASEATKIAVVCHHGVIDWMLDMDFDNCQWREIAFSDIQPAGLLRSV